MASTSTSAICLYSHPMVLSSSSSSSSSSSQSPNLTFCSDSQISHRARPRNLRSQVLGSSWWGYCALLPTSVYVSSIRHYRFRTLVTVAASTADGVPRRPVSGRRVFKQSQGQGPLSPVPVREIASFVVPASLFFAVTFGMDFADR